MQLEQSTMEVNSHMYPHLPIVLGIALLTATGGLANEPKALAGPPNTVSRKVQYRETDLVPSQTEIRYTTLIILPKAEKILDYTCGDKDFWVINGSENFAYVKPAKIGASTNVNLITASGNVYSFILQEVSEVAGAQADLKVFVAPTETSMIAAMDDNPRFVSADAVDPYRKAAEAAVREAHKTEIAYQQMAAQDEAKIRQQYPGSLQFDYRYDHENEAPFNIAAIYRDDKFTYIKGTPQEAPAVYEIKDGKPNLIQYEFNAGLYTIPKILDQGYLVVGKKKLMFRRVSSAN